MCADENEVCEDPGCPPKELLPGMELVGVPWPLEEVPEAAPRLLERLFMSAWRLSSR